jgi:hypothetical protein
MRGLVKRIVKFNSCEAASKVEQHLYHVVQDLDQLKFSEFDEAAFKAAVGLEGLTRADYSYVSDTVMPRIGIGLAPRMFGRPRITLDFTLEAPENHYHPFTLNVLPDIIAMSSEGYDEFPLAIDGGLLHLIRILLITLTRNSEASNKTIAIATSLERACLRIETQRSPLTSFRIAPIRYFLVICGAGDSQTLALNLTDVVLNVNRSIYE